MFVRSTEYGVRSTEKYDHVKYYIQFSVNSSFSNTLFTEFFNHTIGCVNGAIASRVGAAHLYNGAQKSVTGVPDSFREAPEPLADALFLQNGAPDSSIGVRDSVICARFSSKTAFSHLKPINHSFFN